MKKLLLILLSLLIIPAARSDELNNFYHPPTQFNGTLIVYDKDYDTDEGIDVEEKVLYFASYQIFYLPNDPIPMIYNYHLYKDWEVEPWSPDYFYYMYESVKLLEPKKFF